VSSPSGFVLILLGAPGAGKGTYCKELKQRYNTPQISTGDMFRQAVKEGTEIGKLAKTYMDRGALVPDAVVVGIVWDRIRQQDCQAGFILDGFPRTIDQADALGGLLFGVGKELTVVINLEVDKDILIKRLTGRRMCRSCDKGNFNIYTLKPKKDGVCDYCGGELYQRDDDKEQVILNRLKVYEDQTQPLIQYYRTRGQLADIKLEGGIEDMLKRIHGVIDKHAAKT
jgi:adenylate kinase